jgi:two-component sensor histidine kinase
VPLTKILEFSDSAEQLVLRSGIGWAEGLVGRAEVGIERESQAGFTLIAGQPVLVDDLLSETRFSGPQLLHDHAVRSGISVVIPGFTSRPFGVFGIHARTVRAFDMTDAEFLQSLANIVAGAARQVAAAQHRMLLIREMAHRAGNLLQLVSSIASQTFSAHADVEVARRSFGDRLSSLARSNYVVSRGGWTLTRFSELFEETLRPFGEHVTGQGRDVLLPPELCFDMGLVLHELATNSVKYGAMGEPAGEVTARWTYVRGADGSRLFRFVWDDPRAGPRRTPPQGTGFGSKLVAALIEAKWNGTATVSEEDGFRITLEVPVAD